MKNENYHHHSGNLRRGDPGPGRLLDSPDLAPTAALLEQMASGNPQSQTEIAIIVLLRENPDGLTPAEVFHKLGRNHLVREVVAAIRMLQTADIIHEDDAGFLKRGIRAS